MTPEQLADFAARHANERCADELWHALGLRRMRRYEWAQARAAFARIRLTQSPAWRYPYDAADDSETKSPKEIFTPWYEDDANDSGSSEGVRVELLRYDVQTIDDIENLEKKVAAASGDEAKAEALYQLASYYYQRDTLLSLQPNAVARRAR